MWWNAGEYNHEWECFIYFIIILNRLEHLQNKRPEIAKTIQKSSELLHFRRVYRFQLLSINDLEQRPVDGTNA